MKILSSLLIIGALLVIGCSNSGDSDKVRSEARQSLGNPQPTNVAPPISAPTTPGAVNASVKHYICPNNCEGGGGDAAGSCPVCGTELQHNQAYHNTGTAASGNPNPISTQTVPTPQTPEPAQNAAGVWHYTCGNGCEGGAGSAVACASCGATLVHNTTYHN